VTTTDHAGTTATRLPTVRAARTRRADFTATPFVAAAAWYAVFIARASFTVRGRRTFTLFDDAMISMTYGRNLAHGRGLVWNAGGVPVEGITNLMWTLVMVVPHALGFGDRSAALVIQLIGVAILFGCAIAARAVVRLAAPDAPRARTIVTWAVLFCYPLVYWTLRGMEVGLVTLLVLVGVVVCLEVDANGSARRHSVAIAAVCACGTLTRLDFLVFVAALAFWCARRPQARAICSVIGVATGASVVTQELFRRAYYGAWLPNTYALKIGGVPLATRVARGGRAVVYAALVGGAVIVVLAAVAWCSRPARPDRRALALPLSLAAVAAAYCVVVGGDAWEWMRYADRYVTPAIVLAGCVAAIGAVDVIERLGNDVRLRHAFVVATIIVTALLVANVVPGGTLLFGAGTVSGIDERFIALAPALLLGVLLAPSVARRSAPRAGGAATAVMVGVLAFACWAPAQVRWVRANGVHVTDDADQARLGDELQAITTARARIAVVAAGNVPYFARRTGVDLLGKSDPRIAHRPPSTRLPFWPGHTKWDYDISIVGDRPDVVAALWRATPADLEHIAAAGYETVELRPELADHLHLDDQRPTRVLARRDSTEVDWSALEVVDG
jgi:hypothetical protein